MFPPYSLESSLAVGFCLVLPYVGMYLTYRAGWQPLRRFRNALVTFIVFAASYVAIAVVVAPVLPYPRFANSPSVSLNYAMFAALFVFPVLPALIGNLFMALLAWRLEGLRYFFISLFIFLQIFHAGTIAMFFLKIDLVRL